MLKCVCVIHVCECLYRLYIDRAGNRRIRNAKCEIPFRVIMNHFGQPIRNIFQSLRITFDRLQITFANGFAKDLVLASTLF